MNDYLLLLLQQQQPHPPTDPKDGGQATLVGGALVVTAVGVHSKAGVVLRVSDSEYAPFLLVYNSP